MNTSTYVIQGMNCEHCVNSIATAVGEVPGVTGVLVDLPTGEMQVTGQPATAPDAIRRAVEEAGFQVA
ncbi:heavy-metal-associated domain-containing protein [Nonomuraea diastatica]|uniref:Heavy-metal-associated domain-containing protein n=1 Tax=Nonomuraea diastatica TaxID=1848329 RepID=A0A4R4X3D3_9ACTN|nr:heavy metal-associated domain-containing protein [Nonomuraea diastatica]TDD24791.1 heavy-metal-associated domain-containing protein [Nonomuraea diastatica]